MLSAPPQNRQRRQESRYETLAMALWALFWVAAGLVHLFRSDLSPEQIQHLKPVMILGPWTSLLGMLVILGASSTRGVLALNASGPSERVDKAFLLLHIGSRTIANTTILASLWRWWYPWSLCFGWYEGNPVAAILMGICILGMLLSWLRGRRRTRFRQMMEEFR